MIWHQAVGDYGNRLPSQRFAKPSQQKQVIFIAPKYGLAVGATIVNVVITTFVKMTFLLAITLCATHFCEAYLRRTQGRYVRRTLKVRRTFLLIKK